MADAVTMRLEIKGLPELLKKLQQLGGDVENAVAASLMASALQVAGDAKRRSPVKTGNLMRSITATGAQDGPITDTEGMLPEQSVASLTTNIKKGGKADAYIGTNVCYAKRMEFGFKGPDKLGRIYDQGPRPYLRPALDENKDKIERIFRSGLQAVIKSAEEKAAKAGG